MFLDSASTEFSPEAEVASAILRVRHADEVRVQKYLDAFKQLEKVRALRKRPSPQDDPGHAAELESARETLKSTQAEYVHAAEECSFQLKRYDDAKARVGAVATTIATTGEHGSFLHRNRILIHSNLSETPRTRFTHSSHVIALKLIRLNVFRIAYSFFCASFSRPPRQHPLVILSPRHEYQIFRLFLCACFLAFPGWEGWKCILERQSSNSSKSINLRRYPAPR
jgi:hypothetical protein